MDLPSGRTCADCVHCRRCCTMFGHIPEDESCDWSPSRFRLDTGKLEYESWFPVVPACSVCDGPGAKLRPLMSREHQVCDECYVAWYDSGATTPEAILRHRQVLRQVRADLSAARGGAAC